MAWRDALRPNSFRGIPFHVDEGGQAGGRRIAPFEFPKRDDPYPEDMGRAGRRFSISGYVVGPNYTAERDALIAAMEREGPGVLVHQTLGQRNVVPVTYQTKESKARGGMCDFEMSFFEAGILPSLRTTASTASDVATKADAAEAAAVTSHDDAASTWT